MTERAGHDADRWLEELMRINNEQANALREVHKKLERARSSEGAENDRSSGMEGPPPIRRHTDSAPDAAPDPFRGPGK